MQAVTAISDPRLRGICELFLKDFGERFRRTAAARTYHHARRGGLVEHTAQMMRVATQIAPVYATLNLDLLVAGILFHDCGKLWENYLPETGFSIAFDEIGELVGHIGVGLEVVNSLWRKLGADESADEGLAETTSRGDCRLKLLHLAPSSLV